jgi:hypothetical protein
MKQIRVAGKGGIWRQVESSDRRFKGGTKSASTPPFGEKFTTAAIPTIPARKNYKLETPEFPILRETLGPSIVTTH